MPMQFQAQFAVDTNFLMDCARARDAALDAIEIIHRRVPKAQKFIVPTAFGELTHKAMDDPDFMERKLANTALEGMDAWGVFPVELPDMQNFIARSVANKLLGQGILPWKERNDALILAEAAVLGCQLLISSDSHLRDADRVQLARALRECGVPAVVVHSPDEIMHIFGGR